MYTKELKELLKTLERLLTFNLFIGIHSNTLLQNFRQRNLLKISK